MHNGSYHMQRNAPEWRSVHHMPCSLVHCRNGTHLNDCTKHIPKHSRLPVCKLLTVDQFGQAQMNPKSIFFFKVLHIACSILKLLSFPHLKTVWPPQASGFMGTNSPKAQLLWGHVHRLRWGHVHRLRWGHVPTTLYTHQFHPHHF